MAENTKKNAVVSEELASKFKTEKETPYTRWVKAEGLDIIPSFYVKNLNTVALKPWARRGGNAVFLNHDASRTSNDCYVMEIPPGKSLGPAPAALRRNDHGAEWPRLDHGVERCRRPHHLRMGAGALFAIPLNCHHQHFNGSGKEPARYVAVTNAPPVINLYEDLDFIFNTKYDFKDRFAGEPDYFSSKGEQKGFLLTTNFVPDAVNIPLITAAERGAGGGHLRFNMAKGSLNSHISQFPIGTYKKGHAHGPGAHVIVLSGEGFSMMWPEGEEPQRYDWEIGTLIVPPNMWFHQHFNTGTTPSRYLAFKHEGVAIRNAQGVPKAWITKRVGGDQIDYIDEKPEIRRIFATELAKHGLASRMDAAYAKEQAELGVKTA